MWSLHVVELKVAIQPVSYRHHRLVFVEVEVLVLDGPPEPFDKDVVEGAPTPVHTDPHAGGLQQGGGSADS